MIYSPTGGGVHFVWCLKSSPSPSPVCGQKARALILSAARTYIKPRRPSGRLDTTGAYDWLQHYACQVYPELLQSGTFSLRSSMNINRMPVAHTSLCHHPLIYRIHRRRRPLARTAWQRFEVARRMDNTGFARWWKITIVSNHGNTTAVAVNGIQVIPHQGRVACFWPNTSAICRKSDDTKGAFIKQMGAPPPPCTLRM